MKKATKKQIIELEKSLDYFLCVYGEIHDIKTHENNTHDLFEKIRLTHEIICRMVEEIGA